MQIVRLRKPPSVEVFYDMALCFIKSEGENYTYNDKRVKFPALPRFVRSVIWLFSSALEFKAIMIIIIIISKNDNYNNN